jgi:hypothetical protein
MENQRLKNVYYERQTKAAASIAFYHFSLAQKYKKLGK